MAKEKSLFDKDGARKVMRKRDYAADFGGQMALGLMANLVGQLNYFYTDKVGLAVGSVGIVLAIAKLIDAFTDVIAGNMIDHSAGGDHKYIKWMGRLLVPAAVITLMMFTVPVKAGQTAAMIYVLVTNLLLTAVLYTFIATPFSAIMVVRTRSIGERSTMGLVRAAGNYGAGMVISIMTIPLTNMLGGTQAAWIKYGFILALLVLLLFLICWNNGRKAKFACDYEDEKEGAAAAVEEEEPVAFKDAIGMLFRNKYWVIVLAFNLITSVSSGIAASGGTYYCKWIFGNDNLVGIIGAGGLLATLIGFVLSGPIISKLGIKRTISIGLIGAAMMAGIRCIMPTNLTMYITTSMIASFIQIPMMSLYGVLTAMTVDYNEWKYDKKLVAMSGGAIGFGSKVGNGLGSVILAAFLSIGAYDATLAVASKSMTYSILGFSNYLPLGINILMFIIFLGFDLEKKLPQMREEVAARRAAK
ncbi:MAG: MFS transporter [Eubacteriales bacterium]|nr:MFS transporter [Eubacteriales bacterium]